VDPQAFRDQPLLELSGLGRQAGDGSWLLSGIDLQLYAGERLAISGPSGSGKTLLLRQMALLDPCDAGTLCYRRTPPSGADVPRYRSTVTYLQQQPRLGEGTAEDILRAPFEFTVHREKSFDAPRVASWLKQLRRSEALLQQSTDRLSGGELQVVALLRALQLDPVVLLLDEATGAMDAPAAEAVIDLLIAWQQEQPHARALVWVAHDRSQTSRVATREIHLRGGRIQKASHA